MLEIPNLISQIQTNLRSRVLNKSVDAAQAKISQKPGVRTPASLLD